jgi:hypothetical protein
MAQEKGEGSELALRDEKNEVLNAEQFRAYEKLLVVCDRNPNLNGKSPNHNSDFCLIRSKNGMSHIEPTRDFCLKAVSIFGCSYEPVGEPTIVERTDEILVSRDVKVSVDGRYVVETGGCSTNETAKSGARAFHDALAQAMTRGMKRGLEALVGLPFVNMMIKELFSTYQTEDARDVTPQANRPNNIGGKSREIGTAIHRDLKSAAEDGYITLEERDSLWKKATLALANYNQLIVEQKAIADLLEERGYAVSGMQNTQEG